MPDPQYIVARAVLLDVLDALGKQREAVVVVGAQAIYLHTGHIELAVPEFTTDADLTIDPALLQDSPELEAAMKAAHFAKGNRVGAWIAQREVDGVAMNVEVDLMVPEAVGGPGRRAARLPGHARTLRAKRAVSKPHSSTKRRRRLALSVLETIDRLTSRSPDRPLSSSQSCTRLPSVSPNENSVA